MVKNILKVDPVAYRYEDPDFFEGSGIFEDDEDFEWTKDDFKGDDFDPGEFDDSPTGFDPDPIWGGDSPADEEF